MAVIQRSIPVSSTTHTSLGSEVRDRALSSLRAMVGTLNAEISRLQTVGMVSSTDIDKAYERVAWAVDALWEEQELALPDSPFVLEAKRNYVRGFFGGVAR